MIQYVVAAQGYKSEIWKDYMFRVLLWIMFIIISGSLTMTTRLLNWVQMRLSKIVILCGWSLGKGRRQNYHLFDWTKHGLWWVWGPDRSQWLSKLMSVTLEMLDLLLSESDCYFYCVVKQGSIDGFRIFTFAKSSIFHPLTIKSRFNWDLYLKMNISSCGWSKNLKYVKIVIVFMK